MSDTKSTFEEKMNAEMRMAHAELEKMRAKADYAKADAREGVDRRLATLEKRYNAFVEQLEELGKAGEESSDELKSGIRNAWSEFKASLDKASSEFKKKVE